FAVAECNADYKNPLKNSVLLMAAEGYGFEETLYWYDHLEQHIGWKSLGKVLCGGVMDVGDIEGNEKLAEARALGAGI
ncbi:MAG: flavodoxin family protein, partial [Oscillospiraceae bacterium]|nr:flavodoxin family protein [Oscillospiraceae bacterium]